MALITGNTFAVKDQLRALGGRWVPAEKGWMVPEAVADQARALVGKTGVKGACPARGPRVCKDCGQKINYGVYCGKCEYR